MSDFDLNLVTASISPSIQDVRELHALSLPLAGQYALSKDNAHAQYNFIIIARTSFFFAMESAKNRKHPGESEGVGEKRERRNEKERARRRVETKDEKEARLAKMRDRHRASVCYSRDSSRESYQTEAQEYRTATASRHRVTGGEKREAQPFMGPENRITAQHRRHTLEQEHVAHAWSWVGGELQNGMYVPDWFFYHRISKFVDAFYTDVMGAVDFWYRFEWQHRGSPHVHSIAWFADAPDVQHLLAAEDYSDLIGGVENVTSYADNIVSTINPAISMDGSNTENVPLPQTKPHVCNKPYSDFKMDLIELIATCQRHTRSSPAYCLKKKKGV